MTDLESHDRAEKYQLWRNCYNSAYDVRPEDAWDAGWQAARAGNEERLRLEIAVRKLAEKAKEEYFSDNQRLVKWNEELRECLRELLDTATGLP